MIVRQGGGCLSIIGAIVVIVLIILMIPICSAPLLVSSTSNHSPRMGAVDSAKIDLWSMRPDGINGNEDDITN